MPGEGKTFIATNLAISIAMELDVTVMLVDGDVAHPSLPDVLGIPPSPGLLDLLVRDDLDIDDVLLATNIKGLTVLPAGHRDRRATELLASDKMGKLLRDLTARYPDRIIIFDSPPLLPTTEAPVLAAQMGQVVMVVAAESTTQHDVKQALALIERCEVVLMLLNMSTKHKPGGYYGYYADEDPQ
jgi:protein-tyrosine kinase